MNHMQLNRWVLLTLCLLCTGMNSYAVECVGVTSKAAQNSAGRHENGGMVAAPKTTVRYTPVMLRDADESCKKNKKLFLEAVRQNGKLLEYADESLKRDKDVVLAAVRQSSHALKYADETLKNDKTIVLEAVNSYGYALHFASPALKNDKEIVMAAVRRDGTSLEAALIADRDIVLAAVKQNGRALKYASPAMQNDKEVVEAAVMSQPSHGFEYASAELKRDAEFILKMLNKNKPHCCDRTLQYADSWLKNDKAFMLKALSINTEFFKYGGEPIKKDKEIGLYAINHDRSSIGRAFAEFDISLKDDNDVAWAAVKRYGGSYKDVSDRLKKDRDLALAAVKWSAFMWKHVAQSLKDDLGFVHAAAALNPEVIEYMDERLRQDKAIVLIASSHSKKAEKLVKGGFRKDKDVVLAAIENSDGALPLLLDESFQSDGDFIRSAVKKNGGALRYAPAKFVKDKHIVLAAVRNSGMALAFSGKVHQQDKDIVLAAVKQDWRALAYADKALRNDPEIVRSAVKQNAKALIYADQTLATQIGSELGIQVGTEQIVGEISPISEHSRVDSSVLTSDGKRIYVLKNGTLSQYQIDPFRLMSSFKVGIDSVQPPERSDWYQIFITVDESKILIHDTKSIKLLDLASRSISKSVPHDSQNALLVDNVLVTFGPDNLLTLWNAENLLKIKTIAPDYKWTGTKKGRHDEGHSFTEKYSLSRGSSNVFRLGDRVVIYVSAKLRNHGASVSGDIFLINKDTFKLETHIEHYSEDPILSFDHKSIYVSGLKSVEPRKQNAKVEMGGFWANHKYDLESGNVIVVKPGGLPNRNARLSFRTLSPHVPPAGQFHLLYGQIFMYPDDEDAQKGQRLYVYEDGEAVLLRNKQNTFELTDNARKYLRMKASKDELIPVDDATFEKFVVLSDSARSRH